MSNLQSQEQFLGISRYSNGSNKSFLEEIADTHGVFILVIPQATHIFDVNGCDALLHSVQKKRMRSFPAPLCTDHIVRDWNRACDGVCHHRTMQWCFLRAYRWDADGDIDESLILKAIREWYVDTEDEQDTPSESDSDCEWE